MMDATWLLYPPTATAAGGTAPPHRWSLFVPLATDRCFIFAVLCSLFGRGGVRVVLLLLHAFFQVTQKEVIGALQQLAADGHVSYNERSQSVIARGA